MSDSAFSRTIRRPISCNRILTVFTCGVLDLSADVVVDKALAGLVRGLTDTECATYRIDPCPTLEDMRSR